MSGMKCFEVCSVREIPSGSSFTPLTQTADHPVLLFRRAYLRSITFCTEPTFRGTFVLLCLLACLHAYMSLSTDLYTYHCMHTSLCVPRSVCLYTCLYMFVCDWVFVSTCLWIYVCECTRVRVCVSRSLCVHVFVCLYPGLWSVYMYLFMYIGFCVYISVSVSPSLFFVCVWVCKYVQR